MTKSKYSSNRNSWVAIALVLIFTLPILYSLFNGFKFSSSVNETANKEMVENFLPKEPPFKKEGELTFMRKADTQPLKIDVEIADTDGERAQGLMYRTKMAENAGMLFIFQQPEPQSFWMVNTFISLDIIYVNEQKEIVSIAKYTQPKTETSIPSGKPAQYVIEVNAGFCDRNKVNEGDKVQF